VRRLASTRREHDSAGRPFWRGRIVDVEIVVLETGLGLAAAEDAAREALERLRPRCLIATGLAGGLSPAVRVGDAIVPDRVAREGGEALAVDPELRARAALHLPEGRTRRGLLGSVDRVVGATSEKRALAGRLQADAVDMESAALLEQARAASVPALVVRAASDAVDDAVPDLTGVDLGRTSGRLRLAARALLSPSTTSALVRLAASSGRARRTSIRILEDLLPRLRV
jgi:adenosylhomocysteine nucleosidase